MWFHFPHVSLDSREPPCAVGKRRSVSPAEPDERQIREQKRCREEKQHVEREAENYREDRHYRVSGALLFFLLRHHHLYRCEAKSIVHAAGDEGDLRLDELLLDGLGLRMVFFPNFCGEVEGLHA